MTIASEWVIQSPGSAVRRLSVHRVLKCPVLTSKGITRCRDWRAQSHSCIRMKPSIQENTSVVESSCRTKIWRGHGQLAAEAAGRKMHALTNLAWLPPDTLRRARPRFMKKARAPVDLDVR